VKGDGVGGCEKRGHKVYGRWEKRLQEVRDIRKKLHGVAYILTIILRNRVEYHLILRAELAKSGDIPQD